MKANKLTFALLLLAASVLVAGLFYFGMPASSSGMAQTGAASPENNVRASSSATEEVGAASRKPVAVNPQKPHPAGIGSGASAELAQIKDARAREDYINAMFRPLAASGVDAAMARVRQLPDAESRDMAMLALLGEWSGKSVTELAQQDGLGRFGVAGALGLYLMGEGKLSPQQTAAMANEFLSGDQRVGVLGRAAEKLATSDPQAALAMGDGLADWEQTRFLSHFVSGWASVSPDAARAWVAQVDDPRTRSVLMGRVLNEQVKTDPAVAAQTFTKAPPEDARARQRTASQIAQGWAAKDTLAAMQWANGLANETDRTAALQGISRVAPVGIGARVTTGSDGIPVLQDFVPGSPAAASGQLRPGDRLLAVSDASGAWVDSRKLSAGDVVRLIRGEPNTQVSLQVQASDGSGARVVTLPRQQIIHRPGS